MAAVSNTFEGGSDQTTITTGNSGGASGDAWGSVVIPTSGVCKYEATSPYQGSLCARTASRGTAGETALIWTGTQLGTSSVDTYIRFYLRTAIPDVSNQEIAVFANNANTAALGTLGLATSGKLLVRNAADSLVVSSTTVLSASTWYRIECKVHPSTTAAYFTLRIYASPGADVNSYTEEVNGGTPSTWTSSASDFGRLEIGATVATTANSPSSTGFLDLDGIAAGQTSGWYGPLVASGPPVLAVMAPYISY